VSTAQKCQTQTSEDGTFLLMQTIASAGNTIEELGNRHEQLEVR
jgi:hypothetical protein